MTQQRRTPALVALGLAVTILVWVFAAPGAGPVVAVPAAGAPAVEAQPAVAVPSDPDVDSLQIRGIDQRLTRRDVVRTAAPDTTPPSATPPPAPMSLLPTVPAVTIPAAAGAVWPANGPVTSPFGMRLHPVLHVMKLHTGVDFGVPCGTPVAAALPGVVTYVGVDVSYGGRVVVDHGIVNGHRIATTYSHLSALGVTLGQRVGAGTGVGLSGNTGFSTGCHLHVELVVDGSFADPLPWLRNGTVVTASVGQVVPVAPVANPVPEPEVPNDTTTPLLPESPSLAPSPTEAPSTPISSTGPAPDGPAEPAAATEPSAATSPDPTSPASAAPSGSDTPTPVATDSPAPTATAVPSSTAPVESGAPPESTAPSGPAPTQATVTQPVPSPTPTAAPTAPAAGPVTAPTSSGPTSAAPAASATSAPVSPTPASPAATVSTTP